MVVIVQETLWDEKTEKRVVVVRELAVDFFWDQSDFFQGTNYV
jgi:hypothetical protein